MNHIPPHDTIVTTDRTTASHAPTASLEPARFTAIHPTSILWMTHGNELIGFHSTAVSHPSDHLESGHV